jgi:hypothetical protein
MVRNLGDFPNFLVYTSGTESFGNSSVFTFILLLLALYRIMYLPFQVVMLGLVMCFMSNFQMGLDDYPHCTLGKDGFHRTMGRHPPSRVPMRALVCSDPTQLRWANPDLTLSPVSGSRLECVRGSGGDFI